jgi:hypothetical protein
MSWLNDIQIFTGEQQEDEYATDRQLSFIDSLIHKEMAEPFYDELCAASTNIFLTLAEASELIGNVIDWFQELEVKEGVSVFGDSCPFLNDGTRQKDICSRVEYLVDLPNT